MTASSLFTSGRFAIDPELRGAEFERIIQNLDVHFWKAFWNITEIEVLSVSRGPDEDPTGVTRWAHWGPETHPRPRQASARLQAQGQCVTEKMRVGIGEET